MGCVVGGKEKVGIAGRRELETDLSGRPSETPQGEQGGARVSIRGIGGAVKLKRTNTCVSGVEERQCDDYER